MLQYLCLFSLILQGLHEEGECRQLEFWPEKGASLRCLFRTTPKAVKINVDFLGIYKKYWAEEVREERNQGATSLVGAATPLAAPRGLVGSLLAHWLPSSAI